MTRGGKRQGAGRPFGGLAQRSQKVAKTALESGELTPLEIMLEAMRTTYAESGAVAAVPYAKECAPFMHAKFAPVEQKPDLDGGMKSIEELDAMYEQAMRRTEEMREEAHARYARMFSDRNEVKAS